MTTFIIARHGNTFEAHETPRRVGARTDIPLVESGREQARKLGEHLQQKGLIPSLVFASELMRAQETAHIALETMGLDLPVQTNPIFNEIDYGPDENKTEDAVIARIGKDSLEAWEQEAIVSAGWQANSFDIINNWINFAKDIMQDTLVVTSNGIARFAPHITGDFEQFRQSHTIKLSTGAYGLLKYDGKNWKVLNWNVKP